MTRKELLKQIESILDSWEAGELPDVDAAWKIAARVEMYTLSKKRSG